MSEFIVWGCGAWPEGQRLLAEDEIMEPVTPDMPAFMLLPEEFVSAWGEELGSEHWAVRLACDQDDLDAATRYSPNVEGWQVLPAGAGRS